MFLLVSCFTGLLFAGHLFRLLSQQLSSPADDLSCKHVVMKPARYNTKRCIVFFEYKTLVLRPLGWPCVFEMFLDRYTY